MTLLALAFFACAALVPMAGPASAAMIARWSFDEESGTTAFNTAGAFHGTLGGGAMFVPEQGIAGGAVSLDIATNGFVTMGDHYNFTGFDTFSFQAWVKTTMTTGGVVLSRHVGGFHNGYFMSINDVGDGAGAPAGSFHFYQTSPPQLHSGVQNINDGEWHHLVATRSQATGLRHYVDGVRVPGPDSSTAATSITSSVAPFLVGGYQNVQTPTSLYTGLIDEVRIWTNVLSDEEVAWFYENPTAIALPLCGDANESSDLSATDALFALRAAVGTSQCALCVCDGNDSGSVTATDSLLILKKAVGQAVELGCPECAVAAG
ncbi:MAG TPA: LamG-like jellyroll fold domain-containing protein [Candidatus Limnocylindrales bacterium]|nr:LamG-like jellyroll fold domain-containing protein [Candidatus Limnocylindrales bacterium]